MPPFFLLEPYDFVYCHYYILRTCPFKGIVLYVLSTFHIGIEIRHMLHFNDDKHFFTTICWNINLI